MNLITAFPLATALPVASTKSATALSIQSDDETMNALPEEMEPFAETIRDADVTTIAGLRAKTLIAVWDTYRLARNTMVTSVSTMSGVIGLCLAALLALPGFPAWRRLFRYAWRLTPAPHKKTNRFN